jgi:hypothetical protein
MSDDNKEKKRPNANYKMSNDAKEEKRPNANHKMGDNAKEVKRPNANHKIADDAKEAKRPNTNYRLSNENTEGVEIVHHYNRDHRLGKAPKAVRSLYEEQPRRRFGFLHTLVSSRPNAMLFGTIIFLCLMMLMLSLFGFTGDSRELDGNILSVNGTRYDGAVLIEVKKTPRKDKIARQIQAYTGPVEIAVFPAAKKGFEQSLQTSTPFFHKIFFTNDQEEHYYFTVPFEQSELGFIFQTEKKSLSLTVQINNK